MSYTALIDGDIVVYRCGFAAEHTFYVVFDMAGNPDVPVARLSSAAELKEWKEVNETDVADWEGDEPRYRLEREKEIEPLSHALANVKSVMRGIMENTRCTNHKIYLSKGKCFRDKIATMKEYKGNRKDAPKPFHYDAIRKYLIENYGAVEYNSIEADDALALAMNDRTILCSIDKDLLQVSGHHYNWVLNQKILITPEVGKKKLALQAITGDSTDNIPGVKGIGIVKARKALADVEDLEAASLTIWETYLKESDEFEELEDGRFAYTGWDGTRYERTPVEIYEEVYQLVRVGGDDAISALQQAGEELPDSTGTEG
jgi:DNA polymerase-1